MKQKNLEVWSKVAVRSEAARMNRGGGRLARDQLCHVPRSISGLRHATPPLERSLHLQRASSANHALPVDCIYNKYTRDGRTQIPECPTAGLAR